MGSIRILTYVRRQEREYKVEDWIWAQTPTLLSVCFLIIYLFLFLLLAMLSLCYCTGFLQCSKRRPLSRCGAQAAHCGGFSLVMSTAVWCVSSVVVAYGLVTYSMWNIPGPGIEPVSPASQGIFLTTGPPGKPPLLFVLMPPPRPSSTKWVFDYNFTHSKCLVAQSCTTLCDPMDCRPPGSSVHEILQARVLEWVAMPSSRGSSQPNDQNQVSRIAGRFFTSWETREVQEYWGG